MTYRFLMFSSNQHGLETAPDCHFRNGEVGSRLTSMV